MVSDPSPLSEEVVSSIEKNTLLNASKHGGKADVGAVMSKILGEFPHLRSSPASVAKEVSAAVKRVNSMPSTEQVKVLETRYPEALAPTQKHAEVRELPPLPGAVKGKTSFRLPPEPSGFMTIGHAMAFTINDLYKEMYEGELWLRFEDTNPKKAFRRYYDSFRRGIEWLGIKCDHEKNVSDDMELMYEYGRKMVESGLAYACSCKQEKVKDLRFKGVECEHRAAPAAKSLEVWDELLAKKHKEGDYVVRFRGDMKNVDYSLRDPNLFRVIEHSHPLTGEKYTLWPTYDLANTIEDHICGTTHILRSSEFHTELQKVLRERLKLKPVEVIQFSRFNFKGTPVQKRLLRPLVEGNLVSGWDDPRMPTVDGVRRRGIIPETIRQFTVHVGYTKTEHEYDWSMLFSLNRKLLDPVSKRFFFVPDPVKLVVESAPKKKATIPYHPEKDLGSRSISTNGEFYVPSSDLKAMQKGSVFRLMDLYNIRLEAGGKAPRARYVGEEVTQDMRKLQWVTPDHLVTKMLVPDVLYNENGEFNTSSLKEVEGFAESSVSSVKVGEIVQFPRFGFCRLDSPSVFILSHK